MFLAVQTLQGSFMGLFLLHTNELHNYNVNLYLFMFFASEVMFKVGNFSYGRGDFGCLCPGKIVGEEVRLQKILANVNDSHVNFR